jgi:hypothetical protein
LHGYQAHNMELVAYHDLDARPVFKLAMQVVDDRWYLYGARFWETGTTILDVTDPAAPEIVGEIPGPDDPNCKSNQVQVADGLCIIGVGHRQPGWGGDPSKAGDEGIHVWDVSDPLSPRFVSGYRYGGSGTHRNLYAGGRYIHATPSVPGYEGFIYSILDIEDPAAPTEVGRWFFPEQFVAGGATAAQRISHHGPATPVGDRAYLAYGSKGMVILDISDVTAPALVSRLDIGPAFTSHIAMHTVMPLPDRGLAVVNTEAIAELSAEPHHIAGIVDMSDEENLRLISMFPVPRPPEGAGYPNFHTRGGRFGPHNQHHPQGQPHLWSSDQLVYLTWFNAGLRVYDISDPYLPREVGWFLPDDPAERRGLLPKTALVTQSEDVIIDARGYAYLSDKNHGIHVVRYTG